MSRLFCLLVLFISTTFAQDFLLFSTGSDLTNSYIFASGRNSILINTQLTISDTAKVVNTLRTQVVKDERSLTYILVTSDNPSSYLGLATVLQTFPNATVVATAGVASSIASKSAAAIAQLLAMNITDINLVVPPITPLKTNSLTVGANVLTLTELYQVGSDYSTGVWNAATGALFTSFIHYNFHPDLSYSVTHNAFPRYQQALRDLLLLPVQTVYPLVGAPISNYATLVAAVTNIVQYVNNFRLAVAAPNTRAQARDTMIAKYPTLQGQNFLDASVNAIIAACIPSCAARTCGDDGCGGSCGPCAAPFACNINGQCECKSQCSGKFCGEDGCGRTCGTCKYGTCSAGVCVCNPTCAADSCGSDGCGGICKCGAGKVCVQGLTCTAPTGNTVGLDLNFKGIITTDSTCPN